MLDARPVAEPAPDEIFETISQFTFLEKLYNCGLKFEFEWVKDREYHAVMLVY